MTTPMFVIRVALFILVMAIGTAWLVAQGMHIQALILFIGTLWFCHAIMGMVTAE